MDPVNISNKTRLGSKHKITPVDMTFLIDNIKDAISCIYQRHFIKLYTKLINLSI